MQTLKDPRDIYEMIANQAARRIRACLLALIPGDIQEAALQQCGRTLAGASDVPLKERIKAMLAKFKELQVSQEMIEKRYGKKAEAIDEIQLAELRRIYNSIRDDMSGPDDWFERDTMDSVKKVLEEKKPRKQPKPKAAPPEPPPEPPAAPEPAPEPEPEPAPEPELDEGTEPSEGLKGRITALEEKEFATAIHELLVRAQAVGKEVTWVEGVMERLAANQGGMQGPISIRSRDKRNVFLKDINDMVEQWESAYEGEDEVE